MTNKNLFAALFSLTLAIPHKGYAMEPRQQAEQQLQTEQEFLNTLWVPAQEGDFNAQVKLGYIYDKGYGSITPNYDIATEWYEKAAAQQDIVSQTILIENSLLDKAQEALKGYILQKLAAQEELGNGGEANLQKAFDLYSSSASLGNVHGQNELARMYLKGIGTPINYEQSFYWFKQAAEQGAAVAQDNLAHMYWKGRGVPVNSSLAIYWYTKAGKGGFGNAQYTLGCIYEGRNGVPPDPRASFYWYSQAAKQGLAQAQYKLALLYEKGKGVSQSDEEAFIWYKKAAELGLVDAQAIVATIYALGTVVGKDLAQARYWYNKAAKQGSEAAKSSLQALNSERCQEPRNNLYEIAQQHLYSPTAAESISQLNKKHSKGINYIEHYKNLLQNETQGDPEAKQYLDNIRNFKGRKRQTVLENDAKKKLIREAQASLAAESQQTPPSPQPTASTPTPPTKTSSTKKKGKFSRPTPAAKTNKQTVAPSPPSVKKESKIVPTPTSITLITTATTTSTLSTITPPLQLEAFVPSQPPIEPFIPTESKGEKKKTKGTVDKKKMKDKEEKEKKSKWGSFGKKKKNKETTEQDDMSIEHIIERKESTQLALPTPKTPENNHSFRLRKTIRNILKTSKKMLSLDESTIIKTLWGLHEAGEINLRNVVPTETGSFAISDNKIVATKTGDSLVTMVVHAHGPWWEKTAIIKDFVRFLRALSEDDHREFQKAIYNINKDKK